METLSLVISVTSRRNIVSRYITDPVQLPNLALGDTLNGRIALVSETNNPVAPTEGVAVSGSSNIAITDGLLIVYAAAEGITVEHGNELVFDLVVEGSALRLAMALTGAFVQAYLEVRATIDGSDELILREPIVIVNAVTAAPLFRKVNHVQEQHV
jgi:hypothetical protein